MTEYLTKIFKLTKEKKRGRIIQKDPKVANPFFSNLQKYRQRMPEVSTVF